MRGAFWLLCLAVIVLTAAGAWGEVAALIGGAL